MTKTQSSSPIGIKEPIKPETKKLNIEIDGQTAEDLDIAAKAYEQKFGQPIDDKTLAGVIVALWLGKDRDFKKFKRDYQAGANKAPAPGAAAMAAE